METDAVLQPQLTAAPGSYIITWPLEPEMVRFAAKRVHQHSDGRLTGVVNISVGSNSHEVALAHSQLNLASSQSRRGIAKTLEERYPLADDVPWDQVVETSCRLIMEHEDQGEPVIELARTPNLDVEFLVPGILLDRMPNVIYGPGANGKSLLSLLLALLVHNGIDLDGEDARQRNVLVLDYEADVDEAARRATLLAAGIERSAPVRELRLPLFRRCLRPLTTEVTELAGFMLKHNIGLLVIDSFGPAVAADVTLAEQTLAYFAALRQLTSVTNAASLTLRMSPNKSAAKRVAVACRTVRSTWRIRRAPCLSSGGKTWTSGCVCLYYQGSATWQSLSHTVLSFSSARRRS
jgi:hypothetical protein